VSLKVASLFTGLGGLDLGLEAAGFETAIAVEADPVCRDTIRRNRPWPVAEHDQAYEIERIAPRRLRRLAGMRRGELAMVVGGPPCQPFSKSGYWVRGESGRMADPRAEPTLRGFLDVLMELRPRAFLLENVPGFTYGAKDEGLQYVLRGIEGITASAGCRYSVSWSTLNTADYGVPQIRHRTFVVGVRESAPFRFPRATHAPPDRAADSECTLEPYRTAWDAIGDLEIDARTPTLRVGGKWGALLPSIPEGENYLWHTERGGGKPLFGWRTRYWSFLLKLAKTRPSWTIQAQPGTATGPFHWDNRRLAPVELARLQTLPDGLTLSGGQRDQQRMIGNAVPSLMAEVLAREIRRQVFGERTMLLTPTLLPPARGPSPMPERCRPVPKKYVSLIGHHPVHPGTGKGRGALTRELYSQ